MVTRLRLTISIRSDQTFVSYVGQLALLNFQPSTTDFCGDMGTSLSAVVHGEDDAVERIAEVSGSDIDTLKRSAFTRGQEGALLFRGQNLTMQVRIAQQVRFCAQCLIDDIAEAERSGMRRPHHHIYGRPEWIVAPIRTCVRHGIALSAVQTVRGNRQHDFIGAVMPALSSLAQLRDAAVRRPANGLETYLSKRLSEKGDAYLDGFGFSVAARFCELIGSVAQFGPRPLLQGVGENRWHIGGDTGYRIASDGADVIAEFLRGLMLKDRRDPRDGPHVDWGILHDWLEETRDPDIEPLVALAREFAESNYAIGAGKKLLGQKVTERRMHSVTSAAREYGIHFHVLRNQLVHAGVIEDLPDVAANLVLFPAAPNLPLLERLSRGITAVEARSRINCDRQIFFPLVEAGTLAPIVDVKSGYSLFDRQDLDDFIARLSKDAVRYDTKPAGLDTVIDARRKVGCSHTEVVNLILGGKLSKLGVLNDVPGYPAVLVDAGEIARLVRGEDLAGIVVTRISADLGVPYAAMTQMLDVHLPTSLGMHPKRRCSQRIVATSVYQNFKNRYVSLRDLARKSGLNPKTQLADLRRRGINPEPGFPKGAFLFLRSSL